MEFFDRVLETTAFSGSLGVGSVITVTGALSAKFLKFQDRFAVGDPVHFTFEDANGTNWIDCDATLTTTTQLTVTLVEDGTNGAGNAVTMSAGTHRIGNTVGAYGASKRIVLADAFLDHVASGLIWTAAAGLNGNMSAGVCYANGMRVRKGAITNHTFTASSDTYVDVKYDGSVVYNTVSNGAGAPALAAGSIRIGKVVTNSSAVASVVQTGVDSQGNCLRNNAYQPSVSLAFSGASQTSGSYHLISFDQHNFDNAFMWASGAPTRVTIPVDGRYLIEISPIWVTLGATPASVGAQIDVNGAGAQQYFFYGAAGDAAFPSMVNTRNLNKNDYIEVELRQLSGSSVTTICYINVTRIA